MPGRSLPGEDTMRLPALLALALALGPDAVAEEIFSEYTDIDIEQNCSVYDQAGDDGGDWVSMICAGYRGYPVILQYSDLRESVFYGFPPIGEDAIAWESFGVFNSTGPKIEWRIERDGDVETPFATIHRWFVANPVDDNGKQIEVLVVEKVGQLSDGEGCAVAYVVATGNPNANEKARRIADGRARHFRCGDEPSVDAGSVPLPDVVRWTDNRG